MTAPQLVLGRIGKPHGVGGDLVVSVRTDAPEERFAPGTVLRTRPEDAGPLRVSAIRWHSGRLLLRFDDVADRVSATRLAGVELVLDPAELPALTDPDEFYDHQLRGLVALSTSGTPLGTVVDVAHTPAGTLLVLEDDGREVMVPFVATMVPSVDIGSGRIVIDPPDGLFEL